MRNINKEILNLPEEKLQRVLEESLKLGQCVRCSNPPKVFSDSRLRVEGNVFVAIKGTDFDGHSLLAQESFLDGLELVVVEDEEPIPPVYKGKVVKVESTRKIWARFCQAYFDFPDEKIRLYGITGTNGKTSTAWFIANILESIHVSAASIGTLGVISKHSKIETRNTSPGSFQFYQYLSGLQKQGISDVAVEVSSHALDQHRFWGSKFSAVIFTSFSRDHLDYHKTLGEYLAAKCKIFDTHYCKKESKVFIFDEVTQSLEKKLALYFDQLTAKMDETHVFRYGFTKSSKVKIEKLFLDATRAHLQAKVLYNSERTKSRINITIPTLSQVIAKNYIAAFSAVASVQNLKPEKLAERLQNNPVAPVPGRMELIDSTSYMNVPRIFIDYAHTPEGLELVLKDLRGVASKNDAIIVVFGCGGGRDKGKRSQMGAVASQHANIVVLTSDNPRNEDPLKIIEDIHSGVDSLKLLESNLIIEPDRKKAICAAINSATKNDWLLIAGKGEEQTMEINGSFLEFSDKNTVRQVLKERYDF